LDIIKLALKHYIHIRDTTTNITSLIEGPQNYALQSNETLVQDLTKFVQLRNNTYVTIVNPISRDTKGEIEYEEFGQVKLRWGDEEIRTSDVFKDPFPLYPGEIMRGNVTNFVMILANQQLKMMAVRPFYDSIKMKDRIPGDQWMVRGPVNLIPRVEVNVIEKIAATLIKNNSGIKLQAIRDTIDRNGIKRQAGEQWLIREPGAYLPNVDEIITDKEVASFTLTDKVALQLRANCNYTDVYEIKREAGDEWLVTNELKDVHIIDVHESLIKKVSITVLSSRQYCVLINPLISGKQQYGKKHLRRGEASFFLHPGESLEDNKVKEVIVLDENDALLLKAIEEYNEVGKDGKKYSPGDRWLVRGPCEFVLPLELQLLEKRRAIPLDENEGIYVRDINTGEIKIITGQTYLLTATEELWEKDLSPMCEKLIFGQFSGSVFAIAEVDNKGNLTYAKGEKVPQRNKTRVVTFRAPQNSAVQVFDFKSLKCRVVFGPELIKLGPHEEFTVANLSGKKPKIENQIQNLAILLGPDFMSDIIEVETRDHARLRLQLCYSWKFDVQDKNNQEDNLKLFTVNDFVGDACKNLAAKIRGAVSTVTFEHFHKNSATIVRVAVFGQDRNNVMRTILKFESNNLLIINVDVQSQEPVDIKTRQNLSKSTNITILKFESNNLLIINVDVQSQEPVDIKTRQNLSKSTNITIQSQNAMQQADTEHRQRIITAENNGKLNLQKLEDDTHAERQNIEFLKKKIATEVVKTTGELKAKANATAKSNEIQGQSLVSQSELKVQALEIEVMSQLTQDEINIKEEVKRTEQMIDVDLDKRNKLSSIEVEEFKKTIKAIGKQTIIAMAKAGPEVQAKLLQSLGIKSFLITDGKNPINLFNTAKGVIGKK
jgi:major vault protein